MVAKSNQEGRTIKSVYVCKDCYDPGGWTITVEVLKNAFDCGLCNAPKSAVSIQEISGGDKIGPSEYKDGE